jgi:hypothetical protein
MTARLAIVAMLLASSVQAWETQGSGGTGMDRFGNGSSSPGIYSSDGKFLGNLNANRYDPDSVANPYGRYGSRYSPDSINNPYGEYGSRYSPQGARNPYGTGNW